MSAGTQALKSGPLGAARRARRFPALACLLLVSTLADCSEDSPSAGLDPALGPDTSVDAASGSDGGGDLDGLDAEDGAAPRADAAALDSDGELAELQDDAAADAAEEDAAEAAMADSQSADGASDDDASTTDGGVTPDATLDDGAATADGAADAALDASETGDATGCVGDGCPCQSVADCVDDGDLCNGVPYCNQPAGTCATNPASVVSCSSVDDSSCGKTQCQPATGACKLVAAPNGQTCSHANPCVGTAACQAGNCQALSNTCACQSHADCAVKDDDNLCNGTLACDPKSKACVIQPGSVVTCPDSQGGCIASSCAAKTGKCETFLVASGASCDDGQACTVGDSCQGGKCQSGSLACPCLKDSDCAPFEDKDLCNGGLVCDKSQSTIEGTPACVVNLKSVVSCQAPLGKPCLQAGCNALNGKCSLTPKPTGASCDDGSPCTVADTCAAGVCGGVPLACDDGDVCTQDSCLPDAGGCLHAPLLCDDQKPCTLDECKGGKCVHVALLGGCDDGDACTAPDLCAKGACVSKPKACIDDVACTSDGCAPGKGCVFLPLDATACDDGVGCTAGDACQAGVCKGTASAALCDDAKVCTLDACLPIVGCVHYALLATPCDDGDACTTGDLCQGKGCAGQPLQASACDDAKVCTKDSCQSKGPGAGCKHEPAPGPCDDGDACTLGDACSGGACAANTVLPCACKSDADCASKLGADACLGAPVCVKAALPYVCGFAPGTAVVCDTTGDGPCKKTTCAKGKCSAAVSADGSACSAGGDACSAGVCGKGLCVATGVALDCDDGEPCTVDTCDNAAGCKHDATALSGKACDDGDACTVGDACKGGECGAGGAALCDDGAPCTVDLCDKAKGCSVDAAAFDGKACDDGDACQGPDLCVGGVCKGKAKLVCDDASPCTVDDCLVKSGCKHDAAPFAGLPCDDSDPCTGGDACANGLCKGAALDCDDDNACTVDSCVGGACLHLGGALEGKPCAHVEACVKGGACKGAVCAGGDATACGDTGDCAVQPDVLGLRTLQATGRIDADQHPKGLGRVAVLDDAGDVQIGKLDWPIAADWKPAFVVDGPPSVAVASALAVVALDDGGVVVGASSGTGDASAPAWSPWLKRTDAVGKVAWTIAAVPGAALLLRDIALHDDGSVGVVGSVDAQGRAWLARVSAGGAQVFGALVKGPGAQASADRWVLRRAIGMPSAALMAVGSVYAPSTGATAIARGLVVRYGGSGAKQLEASTAQPGETILFDAALLGDGTIRAVGALRASASAPWRPWAAHFASGGALLQEGELLGAGAFEGSDAAVRVLVSAAIGADGGLVIGAYSQAKVGSPAVTELFRLGAADAVVYRRPFDEGGHLVPCAGCLLPAARDGWQLIASSYAVGKGLETASARRLRIGAFGHADCGSAGACGSLDLGDCSDGVACTLHGCDPGKGCMLTPHHAACDDGNVCTAQACELVQGCAFSPKTGPCSLLGACEVTACDAGQCKVTGAPFDCGDADPCTLDSCSSASGCLHLPLTAGSRCRDDAACLQGVCPGNGKGCGSATPLDCNDFEACTLDSCLKSKGCLHKEVDGGACSDGDSCTSGEVCVAGACTGGKVKPCASGQVCTGGTCQSASCGSGNKGLTFTVVSRDDTLDVMRVVAYAAAYGYPPDDNAYVGAIACQESRPVLCLRIHGYSGPLTQTAWSKGELRASQPVSGCGVRTKAAGDKVCSDRFGANWSMHHWHVTGQETFAHGALPLGTRSWVWISDEPQGTCAQ